MKISRYYPSGTEVLHSRSCECQIGYGPRGYTGKFVKMVYLGEGRYMCPVCGQLEDIHGAVYKLIVEVTTEIEGEDTWRGIKVLKPILDKRLLVKDNCTMLEVLEELFTEENEDILGKHDDGVFLWEFFYTSYDGEEDGDVEYELVSEKRLKYAVKQCGLCGEKSEEIDGQLACGGFTR